MWPTKIRELAERTILNPGDREPSKEGGRDLLREGGGSLLEFRSRMFLKAHIHANVLLPGSVLLGDGRSSKEVGPRERSAGHWGHALMVGNRTPFLLLCFTR